MTRAAAFRTLTFAMLAAAGWTGAAAAQDAAAQSAAVLKRTCKPDYQAHCTGSNPAPAIERACLAQFYMNLSSGCRAALDAARAAANGDAPPAGEAAPQ